MSEYDLTDSDRAVLVAVADAAADRFDRDGRRHVAGVFRAMRDALQERRALSLDLADLSDVELRHLLHLATLQRDTSSAAAVWASVAAALDDERCRRVAVLASLQRSLESDDDEDIAAWTASC